MSDKPEIKQQGPAVAATNETPAAPAAPAPSFSMPGITPEQFALLAQILLQREARVAAKEQAEEESRLQKEKQRTKNAQSHSNDAALHQTVCKHLKGGANRRPTQAKDYAVYTHTYLNGEQVIKCTLCRMKWKIRDTKEYLMRYGQRVPNHTKMGWAEAVEMLGQTSNMPSRAEIPFNAGSVQTTEEV